MKYGNPQCGRAVGPVTRSVLVYSIALAAWILTTATSFPLLDQVVIPAGAEWNFFRGVREPSGGTQEWTELNFDDSSWESGPTGIGYGDGDDATVLDDMVNSYVSVYLRKTFTISDAASVQGIALDVDYDDGFIAYLNGTVVAHAGMPPGPVPHDSVALSIREAGEVERFELASDVLVDGENILAIQAHNSSLPSSDLSIIPILVFIEPPECENKPPVASAQFATEEPVVISDGQAFATLDGTASHDGDGGTQGLEFYWSKISGPDGDRIQSPNESVTQVHFSVAGQYSYRLEVNDGENCNNVARAIASLAVSEEDPSEANITVLIDFGEVWRYFEGRTAPPAEWASLGFDDSKWSQGPTNIGYGDFDHATVLENDGEYVTLYVRKRFTAADPSSFRGLGLEIDYDDGFIAYLNDREVVRANMPPSATNTTLASGSHEGGVAEAFNLSGAVDLITHGVNIFAVEIHNVSIKSSDLSFNARLAASDESDPPPPKPSVLFSLDDSSASVGETAAVTFGIRADRPSSGFSFSVNFDEEVLQATQVSRLWEKPDGTPYDFEIYEFNNDNSTPGDNGVDEGYVVGAAVIGLSDTESVLPPREKVDVLSLEFRVLETEAPTSTELSFEDGGQGSGGPVMNSLIAGGVEVTPATAGSFIFVTAVLNIVPSVTPFRRGDTNADGFFDVSDAVASLNYLFVDGMAPTCIDAADANDDGRVEISDPIYTLLALFNGGDPIPSPAEGGCGEDPTQDELECESFGPCAR